MAGSKKRTKCGRFALAKSHGGPGGSCVSGWCALRLQGIARVMHNGPNAMPGAKGPRARVARFQQAATCPRRTSSGWQ